MMRRTVMTSFSSGVLPYSYDEEGTSSGLTGFAGLPIYLFFVRALGLPELIQQNVHLRENGEGYSASIMIICLVLINLAGGDCVQDLDMLSSDEGLLAILDRVESHLTDTKKCSHKEKKKNKKFKQKASGRGRGIVPSASSFFRFLAQFHNPSEEEKREASRGRGLKSPPFFF